MAVRLLGYAFLTVLLLTNQALSPQPHAATITTVSNQIRSPNMECTIKLAGEVGEGDLQKLRAAFKKVNNSDIAAGSLCLNSLGGSYEEGLLIADWMLDQAVFTVIEAHDVCYSACAIIFMTGGTFEDGRSLERYIHPKAVLGFHAPYVVHLPNRLYDKNDLAMMYQLGIKAIRDLTRLGQNHGAPRAFLPPELITELLDKGPSEAFLIDTIYKIVHLNIRLYQYRIPEPTIVGYGNACTNVFYGNRSDLPLDKPPAAWGREAKDEVHKSRGLLWFPGFGAEGSEYCAVQPSQRASGNFEIARTLVPLNSDLRSTDFHTAHPWFLFPPATLLRTTE